MTLEMLANSRAERLIPTGDLRRRIIHRSFGRLQPSHGWTAAALGGLTAFIAGHLLSSLNEIPLALAIRVFCS